MSGTSKPRIFSMRWEQVHSAYIAKAERKDRTRAEVDEVISWFTGYEVPGIAAAGELTVEQFFEQAPEMNCRFGVVGRGNPRSWSGFSG